MRKALDWVKQNKKIIITVALLLVILGALYFIKKGSNTTAATVSTQVKSATEQKLISILSNMDGVGATDVMIHESNGEVAGVVIICQGADNIMTRNNILNAVSTALNIDKKIIAIYSMEI